MLVHPKAFPSNLLACVTKVACLMQLGCRLRVLVVPCAFALPQTCQHPHRKKFRLLASQLKPRCRWRQVQCRTVWWTCAAPKLRNRHPCQRTCRLHSTFQVRKHTLCQTVQPKHMELSCVCAAKRSVLPTSKEAGSRPACPGLSSRTRHKLCAEAACCLSARNQAVSPNVCRCEVGGALASAVRAAGTTSLLSGPMCTSSFSTTHGCATGEVGACWQCAGRPGRHGAQVLVHYKKLTDLRPWQVSKPTLCVQLGRLGAALGARCAAWPSRFPRAPVPAPRLAAGVPGG